MGALPVAPDVATQRLMAQAEKLELVGQYAVRITWRDGHDSGIYDYGILRDLAAKDGGTDSDQAT